MTQAVSRRLFVAEDRVRSQPSLCELSGEKVALAQVFFFCLCELSGEQSGSGTGFFSEYFTFLRPIPFQKCFIIIFFYTVLLPEGQRVET